MCCDLLEHIDRIEDNITEYDRILSRMAKTDHRSQRLMELKGLVPQRPVRWSPVSVMHTILKMGDNWQPGWD
jgi:transposase